jgi:hypothetical protein
MQLKIVENPRVEIFIFKRIFLGQQKLTVVKYLNLKKPLNLEHWIYASAKVKIHHIFRAKNEIMHRICLR